MPQVRIWLTYDLGFKGDYEGIFQWLAEHEAKECGDGTATLMYTFRGSLVEHLKKNIGRTVTLDSKSDRLYVVFPNPAGGISGRFLFGRRKRAGWAEYLPGDAEPDE